MDISTYISEQLKNNKKITFRSLALEREINITEAKEALAAYTTSLEESDRDNTQILYCVTDCCNDKSDPLIVSEGSIRLLTHPQYELSKGSFTADHKQFIYSLAPTDASIFPTEENTPLSFDQMSKLGYIFFPSLERIERFPKQCTLTTDENTCLKAKAEVKEKTVVKPKMEPETVAINPKAEAKENNLTKPKESFFKTSTASKNDSNKADHTVSLKCKDEASVKPKKPTIMSFFANRQPPSNVTPEVKEDSTIDVVASDSPTPDQRPPAPKSIKAGKPAKATPANKPKPSQRAKMARQIFVSSSEQSENDSDAFINDNAKLEAEIFADDFESDSAQVVADPQPNKSKKESHLSPSSSPKLEAVSIDDLGCDSASNPLPKKSATLSMHSWAQASTQSPAIKEEIPKDVPKAPTPGKGKKLVLKRKDCEANLKIKNELAEPSIKKHKSEVEEVKPAAGPPKVKPTAKTVPAKQSNISSFFRPNP
ncbi:hypothetical protein DSO57_1010521 [Entomophthora muscae]|uniref:Uncharacterized protein n=2 Tax=Entomophthora muscae TaxID=34485 RepID=A0ACC2U4J6_9FUNG|nr:hypothetical protein DSO57_1010521 [Entomophthora muscae]